MKFAKVGYGSDGRGLGTTEEGYTYVVNDTVRVGQKLKVIATSHGQMPRKFVTTGVPLATYSQNSVLGQNVKSELDANNVKPTRAFTGAELGASGETTKKDVVIGTKKPQSEYSMAASALAAERYEKENPSANFTPNTLANMGYYEQNKPTKKGKGSTFADYSKPFLKEGDRL